MRGISALFKTTLFFLGCSLIGAAATEAKTSVTKQPYGNMPDGTAVDVYTLTDGPIEARIITYGGIIVSIKVPDRAGKSDDIVLGFDDLNDYVKISNAPEGNPFFGAIIGRYAHRIAQGMFTLNGSKYSVPINDPPNSLFTSLGLRWPAGRKKFLALRC